MTKRVLSQVRRAFLSHALARGLALFLGGFGLLNMLGNFWHPGFDANLWWLDLRCLAPLSSSALVATTSLALVLFGLRPPPSKWGRYAVSAVAVCLLAIALGNAANFYLLLARGQIGSRLPVSFSLLIASALMLILLRVCRASARSSTQNRAHETVLFGIHAFALSNKTSRGTPRLFGPWADLLKAIAVCAACAVVFPLAQMFCFGKTDYRRSADVTVVLGARVYADGRPSDALADRVRTACNLYNAGLTRKLLFSGGPGDGSIYETEAMKRMAVRLGVRPEDILLDERGVNTEATARNTKALLAQLRVSERQAPASPSRILVVSHFYHLPRVKLAYQREGLEVYTVPAKESYVLRQIPYNMAREVAALWVYYLRPLQA